MTTLVSPTPVQAAVLDPGTTGKDLLVLAQTGSGKTVAYGLVIARTLLGDAPRLPKDAPTLALVIAPTVSWRSRSRRSCPGCTPGRSASKRKRAV